MAGMYTASGHLPAAEHHTAFVDQGNRISDFPIDNTDEAMEEGKRLLLQVSDGGEDLSNVEPTPHRVSVTQTPLDYSTEEQFKLDDNPDASLDINNDDINMSIEDSQPPPSPHTSGNNEVSTGVTVCLPTHDTTVTLTLTPKKRQRLADSAEVVLRDRGAGRKFVLASQVGADSNHPVSAGSKRKRSQANNDLAREALCPKSTPRRSKQDAFADSISSITQHMSDQPSCMQELIVANQQAMTEVMQPITESIASLATAIMGLLKQ
jgi:hypothetical protein